MGCIYPTFEMLITLHDENVIKKSGGVYGILNGGLLHSCVDMIQNDTYYPDFEAKLNHLVFSLIKSHCFNDGNKRTAIAGGALFLELNATPQIYVSNFIRIMERVVLLVANNQVEKDELLEIVTDLANYGELSEESMLCFNRPLPDDDF